MLHDAMSGLEGSCPVSLKTLAFDVGANTGQDTAALLARGFRVVAVEANPRLCVELRERFAAEIAEGRLTIVDKAISGRKKVTFYVNSADSGWGTTLAKYAARGESVAGTIEEIDDANRDYA
jgi:FkbM family methyltransferase